MRFFIRNNFDNGKGTKNEIVNKYIKNEIYTVVNNV